MVAIPIRSPTLVMFSTGDASPGESLPYVVTPDGMIQVAPSLLALRATIIVENASLKFKSQVFFQPTEDGIVWGTPVALEAAPVLGNRKLTLPWWSTDPTKFSRGIRVIVIVTQDAVGTIQMANVTVITDLQLRS